MYTTVSAITTKNEDRRSRKKSGLAMPL